MHDIGAETLGARLTFSLCSATMLCFTPLSTISSARWSKLISGLFCFGLGTACMKRSSFGLAPWEVLNDGIAERTGMMLGTASIVIGMAVLLLWIPLRLKPDVGTILNMVLVGAFTNVCLKFLGALDALALRLLSLGVSIPLIGLGSALYLGSHLGAGPRDGLMVGIHRKTGLTLRLIRTTLEIAVLFAGYALGGSLGPGTVVFALTIGPMIHWMMSWTRQTVR